MLERYQLRDFVPSANVPLVISLVEELKSAGYTVEIAWEHWDFLVYDHEDEPVMVIKTVKNSVRNDTISHLLVENAPIKVILVDGDRPDYEKLSTQRIFLASTGTAVYVRNVGWLSLPSHVPEVDTEELRFKLSKRWTKGKDGIWRKKCTKCGVWKTAEEYYRSAYRTAKDPYRNVCKECMIFDEKLRWAAKKGKKRGK